MREIIFQKDFDPVRVMPPKARGGKGKSGKTRGANSDVGEFTNSGSKINIPVRDPDDTTIQEFVKLQTNLSLAEDCISLFKETLPAKIRNKVLSLDSGRKLLNWEPLKNGTTGWLTFKQGDTIKKELAFKKTIPLVDPYHWMRFKERPSSPFIWKYQKQEIVSPENQGYVDCVASCLVSNLKTSLKSPHFCEFYGAFRAVIDVFHYNLEEDLEDFRFTKWFWSGFEAGEFGLRMIEKSSGRQLTKDEIIAELKPDEEFLHDDEDNDEDDSDESEGSETSSISAQSLHFNEVPNIDQIGCLTEIDSVDNIPSQNDNIEIYNRRGSVTPKTVQSISTATDENLFTAEYTIHAELYEMPVAIQYLEQFEGTMDDLLEDKKFSPILNSENETQWSAWLFQVCAACTQLQNSLRLTHNDLHTCNVLWKKTDIEFLHYITASGRMFKIPTYGKLFSIIDYGRAIFAVNNFVVISSDYNDGHDACGMYNFGPIQDDNYPVIRPNKSFDLCRLACSLLRGLFPRNPPEKQKGSVLTQESSWKVTETISELFNLLWIWLRTKSKESVLENKDGDEKYPGFNLYAAIAKDVGEAVPEEQIVKPIFSKFSLKNKTDGKDWILIP